MKSFKENWFKWLLLAIVIGMRVEAARQHANNPLGLRPLTPRLRPFAPMNPFPDPAPRFGDPEKPVFPDLVKVRPRRSRAEEDAANRRFIGRMKASETPATDTVKAPE